MYGRKIIFKTANDITNEVISTTDKWDQKERFSISHGKHKNVFSVRITAVTPDDGGVYLCAVWINTHPYSYSTVNIVHLHIISKYKVSVSRVSGYTGGGLMIKCEHPQYKTKPKYICKESDGCSERKNPGVQDEWMENGDVSLYDDTRAGVLMVFFRELKAAEAGTYRCGVNVSHYTERFTELQLSIKHNAKYPKSVTESVYLGEEVNITCQIPEEHKVHFCKEDDNHICQNISSSKVTQMIGSSERNEERVFTVIISNVSVRDAGVYWCGAETRDTYLTFTSLTTKIQLNIIINDFSMIIIISVCVILLLIFGFTLTVWKLRHKRRDKVGVSSLSGFSGGGLMIKCEHPQYKTKPKYICKESDGCSERKNPGVQDEWMENGDVSLYDDTRAGVLMVFFRELKAADAGTYRCGVNVSHYTERFTELQLNIKHDEKYLQMVTESAHFGEEINITCQIPEHNVYFCKEDDNHICQNISSSKVIQMNRSSVKNKKRVFVISNVSVRDAGVYWCGAETRDTYLTFISLNTKIQLIVIMPPVVKHEGESAEIICPYDSIYKSKSKSLCKGKCSTRDRNTLNETVREEKETKTDRLTLNDDITANVFTGTITGLTAEDAGKYWCAVTLERDLDYLYTHLIVIMNEELNLTKYEGDDVSIQCKHQDEDQKSFCKAHEASMCVKDGVSLEMIRDDRFSFSDEASTGVFTVNITDLREEDSGIYWCGAQVIRKVHLNVSKEKDRNFSMVIVISVCVNLLLIGGFTLTVWKLRHRRQGSESPRIVLLGKTGSGKTSAVEIILGQRRSDRRNTATEACVAGKSMKIIDTPGLIDAPEQKMEDEIKKFVWMSAPGPHVFLLVIKLDTRLTNEEKNTERWILENIGERALDHTIVLFTHADCLRGKSLDEYIRERRFLQLLVVGCGGRFHSFNNQDRDDNNQVTELLEKIENTAERNEWRYYTNEKFEKMIEREQFIENIKQNLNKVAVGAVPNHINDPKIIFREEKDSIKIYSSWKKKERFIISDEKHKNIFSVRITAVTPDDGGVYLCGVWINRHPYSYYIINTVYLHIMDAKYPMDVTKTAYHGEEVNITCQIPEKHKVHFCKEDDNHICQNISSSKVTQMKGSSERNEERVFTVIISNVSVRDAGVYWCGAETRDTYLTFISLTTKIQLNITMPPVVRHEGESAEIICPYDSIYKSKPMSLCKGKCSTRDRNTLNDTVREEKETKTDRLTLNDDINASVFTGTITGLTAEDAGKYWCAVTLERDLNYLYTHLIVIMNEELNLTKYEGNDVSIQCKHQDEDQKSFCKAHEASMCVKDGVSLETIRDDRFSFSDEASTGVFTVNITDLREEDSGIYWCGAHVTIKVNLTVKKDFSMIIIINVCVILLLIGGFTLTVWKLRHKRRGEAHTHSPTIPSDGLLYADVSFKKHKESLSDATVRFSKDEIHSDYAAVSHHMRLN
ncbi:polymeric immunoglobulin receptor-like protein [Labeo rohita]|nr:polymeric immunoglobulin receptor-like protein [Labeo rohita]